MICNQCGKEMPEVGDFCPYCGASKDQEVLPAEEMAEETPVEEAPAEEAVCEEVLLEEEAPVQETAKKKKKWPLILGIVGGSLLVLALLAFLTLVVLNTLGVIDLTAKGEGIQTKAVYTVEEEKAAKKADAVVATMGDYALTNGQLQLYYQNAVYTFYNENYYYISYMGLDLTQPLDQQECMMAEGLTWEQYFLQSALDSWEQYTVLNLMAEDAAHVINPELQSALDTMITDLETDAVSAGYESAAAYITDMAGANVDLEDFVDFNRVYYVGNDYLSSFYDNAYPTDQETMDYYTQNQATFAENGVGPEMGKQADVRHILIAPEIEETTEEVTEETTEDTTSAQEQAAWDAALLEAQTLLDAWKAGEATEDSFAALVADNTDDAGSAANGGLYEDVNADTNFVPEFLEWTIDNSRQPGDTEIVKTDHGYHIMYYVAGEDYYPYVVAEQLVAERIQEALLAAMEQYPAEYKYKNICIAQLDMM